jgi:hypothetical protein
MSIVRTDSLTGYSNTNSLDRVVRIQNYNTGFGSGARTTTASTSFIPINMGGDLQSGTRQSGNLNRLLFNKRQTGTDLIIKASFPVYITGTGDSGGGIRLQYSTNGSSFSLVDALTSGPADGWGAWGYGNDHAGIVNYTWVTSANSSIVNTVRNHTGNLFFYFEIRNWSGSDTSFFIDYDSTYPKYGTIQILEIIQG